MSEVIIDEGLFSAELPEPGIMTIRTKRQGLKNISIRSMKANYFEFLDEYTDKNDIKCVVLLGNAERRGEAEVDEWIEDMRTASHEDYTVQRVIIAFQQHVRRILTKSQIVLYGDAGKLTNNYLSVGLASDFFVLADTAIFQNANSKYNLLPFGGAAYLLSERIGRSKALSVLATYKEIPAEEILYLGACDAVCQADDLEETLMKKARAYAAHSSRYLASLKAAMRPNLERFDEWLKYERNSSVVDLHGNVEAMAVESVG